MTTERDNWTKRITFVDDHSDEWIGIYIDGKLVGQGHSFQPEQVLQLLGIDFDNIQTVSAEDLPDDLSAVVQARR